MDEKEREVTWFDWYVDRLDNLSTKANVSLTQARANYREIGACETRFIPNVRPPRPDEL